MNLGILTLVYVAVGVCVALFTLRRTRDPLDALLVVLAWPLYAPTLGETREVAAPLDEPERAAIAVRAALTSVRDAARGSPFATLLGSAAEARLIEEIARAAARMRAVDHELAAEALNVPRPGGPASLRADLVGSLRALRAADTAAMDELVELLGALRSRIVLARHAGSSAEGPSAIVAEVWARIEGLGEAVACTAPGVIDTPPERSSAREASTAGSPPS